MYLEAPPIGGNVVEIDSTENLRLYILHPRHIQTADNVHPATRERKVERWKEREERTGGERKGRRGGGRERERKREREMVF